MNAGIAAGKQDNPMDNSKATKAAATDRFGNPIDPVVGYARGAILRGTDEEVEKLKWAERWGADTVMDLSTGGNLDDCRTRIVPESTVPIAFFLCAHLGERGAFCIPRNDRFCRSQLIRPMPLSPRQASGAHQGGMR